MFIYCTCLSLMYKCVQNGSSNGGPDAVLESALIGGRNAALELALQCNLGWT